MPNLNAKLAAYYPRLLDYARRHLRLGEAADDIVHEALVVVLEHPERVPAFPPEQLYAWLRGVVQNVVRNKHHAAERLKRDRRRECRLQEAAEEVLIDAWPSPAAEVVEAERDDRVVDALGRIASTERLSVVLHCMGGWTQARIGETLGLDRSTVAKRIDRGLRQLKKDGLLSPDDLT